ncbi:hypothetical protein KKI24_22960 [bacterium]|nr:hypothetical protein [bacterium]
MKYPAASIEVQSVMAARCNTQSRETGSHRYGDRHMLKRLDKIGFETRVDGKIIDL